MRIVILHFAVLAFGFLFGVVSSAAETEKGQASFEKRCTGCHALDAAKEGPALRGVFGRPAGKQANFPYSDGLKGAKFVWDKSTLEKWLTDPESVVPGTDMAFRLSDKTERERIITYLQQLKSVQLK